MEVGEGAVGSQRGGGSPKSNSEIAHAVPGWNYEKFRVYLIAASKGRDYLLPIEEYPERIDLSDPWHKMLDQIRDSPIERWALIGYETGQHRLVLPTVSEKGLSHSVPSWVMMTGLEKARRKAGITDLVGDAHSHPRPFTDASWLTPRGVTSKGVGAFSLLDLYGLLDRIALHRPADPKRTFMVVAEGNETIVGFATRRCMALVRNKLSVPYETFATQWYEKYGWKFKGRAPASEGGGELAVRNRADAPPIWQINKGIAFEYQLALYRGFKGGSLLREHPARPALGIPK